MHAAQRMRVVSIVVSLLVVGSKGRGFLSTDVGQKSIHNLVAIHNS